MKIDGDALQAARRLEVCAFGWAVLTNRWDPARERPSLSGRRDSAIGLLCRHLDALDPEQRLTSSASDVPQLDVSAKYGVSKFIRTSRFWHFD